MKTWRELKDAKMSLEAQERAKARANTMVSKTESKPIPLAQLQRFAARMPGAQYGEYEWCSWVDLPDDVTLYYNGRIEVGVSTDAHGLYAALKILFEECGEP